MKQRVAYFSLVALFVATFIIAFGRQAGPLPAAIIGGAMTVALFAWSTTTLRNTPNYPPQLLTAYLLTGAALMAHIAEEYAFEFASRMAQLGAHGWTQEHFAHSIVFFGPAVWILGAAAIAFRNPLGGYFAWFLFVAMIFAEPVHYVFPLLEGLPYDYFPGMWTALLPMVPAIWGLRLLTRTIPSGKEVPA